MSDTLREALRYAISQIEARDSMLVAHRLGHLSKKAEAALGIMENDAVATIRVVLAAPESPEPTAEEVELKILAIFNREIADMEANYERSGLIMWMRDLREEVIGSLQAQVEPTDA